MVEHSAGVTVEMNTVPDYGAAFAEQDAGARRSGCRQGSIDIDMVLVDAENVDAVFNGQAAGGQDSDVTG